MERLFNLIERPIPQWFTLFDLAIMIFAGFALGVMLGHILGKR